MKSTVIICCVWHIEAQFALGIEELMRSPLPLLIKARIGLVANQTSCDQSGKRTVDLLQANGLSVSCIFTTEHGFNGTIAASQEVPHGCDAKTGIAIISLYGKQCGFDRIGLIPVHYSDMIDCLVFDIQDVGMRHYTYVDTLLKVLQSAAYMQKPIIVCDRPNLLGNRMEGPPGNPRIFKQETVGSLPLRHGMTIGEIARHFNERVLLKKAALHVVPMRYYERTMDVPSAIYTASLSPNIRSKESAHGYSFLGILGEVRPLDIGIGTEKAFQCIMLPEEQAYAHIPWDTLQSLLKKCGIQATAYRYLSDRKKKWFNGVQIAITDIKQLRSFETLLQVLDFFKQHHVPLVVSSYFDTAVGNARVRLWLEGKISKEQVIAESKDEVRHFLDSSQHLFLYAPLPQITYLQLHNENCII